MTKSEREGARAARMEVVSQLFLRGWSYRKIRAEVMARLSLRTYSLETVGKDVSRLLSEYRERRADYSDRAVDAELARISAMEREAWEGWEKSKEDYVKKRQRKQSVPDAVTGEMITSCVTQEAEEVKSCGDPRFLDTINKLQQERRRLLGLYAPERKELTGAGGSDLIRGIDIGTLTPEQRETLLSIGTAVLERREG